MPRFWTHSHFPNQPLPLDHPSEDRVALVSGDTDLGVLDLGLDLTGVASDQDEFLMSQSTNMTSIYGEYDNHSYEYDEEEEEVDLGVEGTSALEKQEFEDDKVCMV